MRYKRDPRQTALFDEYAPVFSDVALRRIRSGWWQLFRTTILKLMPVDQIGKAFHPSLGTRTKELYSMAGLLLIKEFNNWTEEQAVDAYMFDNAVQYALNLAPAMQSMSIRTLQRYEKIFRDSDLAARVMNAVTMALVKALELDVARQRLDSTHLKSDMAVFSRTRLLGVTIKRFLVQVKRHDPAEYKRLPEEFRKRYEPSPGRLFANATKEDRTTLRQQVAEDLHWLIERFADQAAFRQRQTYRMMVQAFEERCEVTADKVTIKKNLGGDLLQNPSDPDAAYDGHKGIGYQMQICETCSDENDVQLITAAKLETAVVSDQEAVEPILTDLQRRGLLPARLEADGGYGRDRNVCVAEAFGVDLQSPVGEGPNRKKQDTFALCLDDFVIEPEVEIVGRCPAGCKPLSSTHDRETGVTTTVMPAEACGGCPFGRECPIKRVCSQFRLQHTAKERRLVERRREQATKAFRENYRKRAGGESVNSGLKRRTGLGRLRVRGRAAVAHAGYLRVAGWNILRAAASPKLKARLARAVSTQASSQSDVANNRACGRRDALANVIVLHPHQPRRRAAKAA